MFKNIRHYFDVASCFMRLAIQTQMEYPSFLIAWFIGIPIQYGMGVWMIGVITERFQSLNGWAFPQIAFIYGLSVLSHGIMVVFFIQTWGIERMVRRGGFDRFLLRPMNVFFQFCVNYFNFIGLIDLIPGIVIFVYGCSVSGFRITILSIFKVILVLIGAVLIRAAFFTATGSIAFWTYGSSTFVWTGMTMMERVSMYPMSIYPYFVQVIFTFVLPFGFISFYPASEFFGFSEGLEFPFNFALLTPAVGIVCAWVAFQIFNKGMKRYESAGS